MICFYKDDKVLIKVFDQGDDLQLLCNVESQKERWFSVWQDDKKGSVYNALKSVLQALNFEFDIMKISWIK